MKIYDPEYIEDFLKGIYDGSITEYDLPEDLYYAIADYLKKGLYEGFGITLDKLRKALEEGASTAFNETDLELLTELRENVYMFSAAKTFQQVKEMSELLLDGDKVREWADFRDQAKEVFDQYNENWLGAEYDTAIGQGMMGAQWNQIEKDKETMPYLRYNGQPDDLECEICAPLNDLVARVDDPIWASIYPENHFRCRCTVDQIDQYEGEGILTPDDVKTPLVEGVMEKMDPNFLMNAGIDKVVFSPEHPYFTTVSKADKDFAKENFGLPIPDKD